MNNILAQAQAFVYKNYLVLAVIIIGGLLYYYNVYLPKKRSTENNDDVVIPPDTTAQKESEVQRVITQINADEPWLAATQLKADAATPPRTLAQQLRLEAIWMLQYGGANTTGLDFTGFV